MRHRKHGDSEEWLPRTRALSSRAPSLYSGSAKSGAGGPDLDPDPDPDPNDPGPDPTPAARLARSSGAAGWRASARAAHQICEIPPFRPAYVTPFYAVNLSELVRLGEVREVVSK